MITRALIIPLFIETPLRYCSFDNILFRYVYVTPMRY